MGAGVTFGEPGATDGLPPKPGLPTFDRIMGREPVPLAGPLRKQEAPPEVDEAEQEAAANRIARAQAMLYEAAYKRKHLANGPAPEPEPSPPE